MIAKTVQNEREDTKGFSNGVAVPIDSVPILSPRGLQQVAIESCSGTGRIVGLIAFPSAEIGYGYDLILIVADKKELSLFRSVIDSGELLPSLSTMLPQVERFERELHETNGILIEGHPALTPLRKQTKEDDTPAPFQVTGDGVHEVALGPAQGGMADSQFRFQCHGERVLSMEIQWGYQHRGAENLLVRSKPARRMVLAESISGDTVIGHALAYSMAMEGLSDMVLPPAAEVLRAITLEMERVANHIGDLSALSEAVAYLPGASAFGRLRDHVLNLFMDYSGNRYGRGILSIGGVRIGLDRTAWKRFLDQLDKDQSEFKSVVNRMFDTPSVRSSFEQTGLLPEQLARDLGLVGPSARASGLSRDTRRDFPFGLFQSVPILVACETSGDVWARAQIRRMEVEHSLMFIQEQLRNLPDGPISVPMQPPAPNQIVVSLVEGWRGEIAHVAVTGDEGQLLAYKIIDPSFHNGMGLAMAMRDQPISLFPLCEKSFNLSSPGHDL
jgi:Ni,Fe-hydrogenase III large subunit